MFDFFSFSAKSASQQVFTHHMVGKFRLFLQSQQVSTLSHTTCVRKIFFFPAKSASQQPFTHHMGMKKIS
jgi:hypothetical protein